MRVIFVRMRNEDCEQTHLFQLELLKDLAHMVGGRFVIVGGNSGKGKDGGSGMGGLRSLWDPAENRKPKKNRNSW